MHHNIALQKKITQNKNLFYHPTYGYNIQCQKCRCNGFHINLYNRHPGIRVFFIAVGWFVCKLCQMALVLPTLLFNYYICQMKYFINYYIKTKLSLQKKGRQVRIIRTQLALNLIVNYNLLVSEKFKVNYFFFHSYNFYLSLKYQLFRYFIPILVLCNLKF